MGTLFVLNLSKEVNQGLACQFKIYQKADEKEELAAGMVPCRAPAVASVGRGESRIPLCPEHARTYYGRTQPKMMRADGKAADPGAIKSQLASWALAAGGK